MTCMLEYNARYINEGLMSTHNTFTNLEESQTMTDYFVNV